MSATDVIQAIEELPAAEQERIVAYIRARFAAPNNDQPEWQLREKPFTEAAERIFRENHELFRRLASKPSPDAP
ncbi:MAG: hypothetical protein Q7T30_03375 [Planctomycetota bacterium]|nr:hypothetical protein [Planctomycetota bacterium]